MREKGRTMIEREAVPARNFGLAERGKDLPFGIIIFMLKWYFQPGACSR